MERSKSIKTTQDFLTRNEANALFESFDSSPIGLRNHVIAELLYTSAIRPEQICNLRFGDYKPEHRIFETPKRQLIIVSEYGLPRLLAHIEAMKKNRRARRQAHMFLGTNGKPLSPTRISQFLKRHGRLAGLRKVVGLRTLRHSFVLQLLAQGANLKDVSELIRWGAYSSERLVLLNTFRRLGKDKLLA